MFMTFNKLYFSIIKIKGRYYSTGFKLKRNDSVLTEKYPEPPPDYNHPDRFKNLLVHIYVLLRKAIKIARQEQC